MLKTLTILTIIYSVGCQNSNIYWGSYELTIPGGSGSGNAVQHLKLPENAPEFFQFSALKKGPPAAPTFPPAVQPASQPQELEVLTRSSPQTSSAELSRFQSFQLRRQQEKPEAPEEDLPPPARPVKRLRKIAVRRRRPQNKE